MFNFINLFINISPQKKKQKPLHKYDTMQYIGYYNARTRRIATIALDCRGWHWEHELRQPGGHATGTEGNKIFTLYILY